MPAKRGASPTMERAANFLPQNKGLPQQNAFAGIYRKGIATDARNPAGIYFGTNTGKLFGSADEGDS
jgi:hypothetical protein